MRKGRYARKQGKYLAVILCLLVLVLVSSSIGVATAKYVYQRKQDMMVQAEMFYFTSDLLKEEGAEYTLNANTPSVTIQLYNYADALRKSNAPVQCTVYVNDIKHGETVELNEANNGKVEVTIHVESGKTYQVKAEGVYGYEKTLSATFHVDSKDTGFYKHVEDTGYYVLLTVWTEDISGDVTVEFPEGLIPDETDPVLAGIKNYSDGTYDGGFTSALQYDKYSSRTYRFFKEDIKRSYQESNFTVTMGEHTAQSGKP